MSSRPFKPKPRPRYPDNIHDPDKVVTEDKATKLC